MTFQHAFEDELKKIAGFGSTIKLFAQRQLGGLGLKRFAHVLEPGEETLKSVLGNYARHPVMTFKRYLSQQGPFGIGLNAAFTGMAIPEIMGSRTPSERGAATGRTMGYLLAGLGTPINNFRLLPSIFLFEAGGRAGGAIGKTVGRVMESRSGQLQQPAQMTW